MLFGMYMALHYNYAENVNEKANVTNLFDMIRAADFQVVKNIPELPERQQPTCAIITLLYAEKQAVDVMMDNKTTYVRYRREGTSLIIERL